MVKGLYTILLVWFKFKLKGHRIDYMKRLISMDTNMGIFDALVRWGYGIMTRSVSSVLTVYPLSCVRLPKLIYFKFVSGSQSPGLKSYLRFVADLYRHVAI